MSFYIRKSSIFMPFSYVINYNFSNIRHFILENHINLCHKL